MAAEKKKSKGPITMLLLRPVFYVFMGKKHLEFFKNTLASALKSYMIQGQLQEWTEHSHTDLPKSETSRDIKNSF
jgi:hypothetical protein